jgi:hypothetical protein
VETEIRLRKIGTEKVKFFDRNFDRLYDFYKRKAEEMNYRGDLKFIKERGKILIYTVIEYRNIED